MKRVLRLVLVIVTTLAVLMLIPPARNLLTLGYLPPLWKEVSTFQLVKVHLQSVASGQSALVPCLQPAQVASDTTGHREPLQQLLMAGSKIQARPQDVVSVSKALTWLNESAERRQRYSLFAPEMTPVQKTRMLLTWRVLHEALTSHNISHFLVSGAMLGAVRHGGMIPWDDEMDVAIDEQDLGKIQRALSCLPGYTLRLASGMFWKFFRDDGKAKNLHSGSVVQARKLEENEKKDFVPDWRISGDVIFRCPYIDLFLLTGDDSYIWCKSRFNIPRCMFRLEEVYPLITMNFEGYQVPVPRRAVSMAQTIYDANVCHSSSHYHLSGRSGKQKSVVPCKELDPMYTVHYIGA